ncbi:MAG: hypothetical protein ABJA94_08915, partial [Rhodoglobus sp.]
MIPIGVGLFIILIAVAKGLRETGGVQAFIRQHPGLPELPAGTPVGFPVWLEWQHFLNLFFMLFIIRSGITVLADHPRLYWTRHSTPGKD